MLYSLLGVALASATIMYRYEKVSLVKVNLLRGNYPLKFGKLGFPF